MHVPLICLSVIMLRFVLCSGDQSIEDLSDRCSKGRIIYNYLTSRAGPSDKIVSMLATEKEINCTAKFSVKSGNYIMLVLEFPDMRQHEEVCYTEQNNSVTLRDNTGREECLKHTVKDPLYRLSKDKATVGFISEGNFTTVKIIATSMRDPFHERCLHDSETECVIDERIYCMTQMALCDGYNNCGVPNSNDEDFRKCKGPSLSFLVILCSLIMFLMTLALFLSIVLCLVPKRKDPYVHHFDQDLSLFDCENGIVTVEIDIVILFPEKKTFAS